MKFKPVNSSNIKSVGYDALSKLLKIKFHNGSKYSYSGVSFETYQNFMEAESLGKFFNQHIKNNQDYSVTKS